MNKKTFVVLAAIPFVAACAASETAPVSGQTSACTAYAITATQCGGDKNNPVVVIDTVNLTFNPPIICSKKQKIIRFELNPPPEDKEGTAAIIPKNFSDAWLTGTNVPNKDRIRIKVPNWVSEKTYEYMFVTSTGKCVDPRVEVTN